MDFIRLFFRHCSFSTGYSESAKLLKSSDAKLKGLLLSQRNVSQLYTHEAANNYL